MRRHCLGRYHALFFHLKRHSVQKPCEVLARPSLRGHTLRGHTLKGCMCARGGCPFCINIPLGVRVAACRAKGPLWMRLYLYALCRCVCDDVCVKSADAAERGANNNCAGA